MRQKYDIWPGPDAIGWNVAENKPATPSQKKNFAQALSDEIAKKVANALRPSFRSILPDVDGYGLESRARTAKGYKKLDVNYSTIQLGLGLGISIKTLNFRDKKSKRYTKNFTRIDNELRAEAQDYHERQPYAVLCSLFFLPLDAADDYTDRDPSSFGQAVQGVFRFRGGRTGPRDLNEKMERVILALYDPGNLNIADGDENMGNVVCFDSCDPPPWAGLPQSDKKITFSAALHRIIDDYDVRNGNVLSWSDRKPDVPEQALFDRAQELANEDDSETE